MKNGPELLSNATVVDILWSVVEIKHIEEVLEPYYQHTSHSWGTRCTTYDDKNSTCNNRENTAAPASPEKPAFLNSVYSLKHHDNSFAHDDEGEKAHPLDQMRSLEADYFPLRRGGHHTDDLEKNHSIPGAQCQLLKSHVQPVQRYIPSEIGTWILPDITSKS